MAKQNLYQLCYQQRVEISCASQSNISVQSSVIGLDTMTIILFNLKLYFVLFNLTLESVKDARKLFRLLKSIVEYQKLIDILLDDQDDLLKLFRVLAQVCFFFYWFFDNISILCKIKLLKGDFAKHNVLASIFWLFSLLISIPVLAIQATSNPKRSITSNQSLDCIKYTFDLLPASKDSKVISKFFNMEVNTALIGLGGLASGLISTYQVLRAEANK